MPMVFDEVIPSYDKCLVDPNDDGLMNTRLRMLGVGHPEGCKEFNKQVKRFNEDSRKQADQYLNSPNWKNLTNTISSRTKRK